MVLIEIKLEGKKKEAKKSQKKKGHAKNISLNQILKFIKVWNHDLKNSS